MKTTIFFLALLLALPIEAAPAKPAPKAVPMARQRTVQEDAELRDWIVGIQTLAAEAVKKAEEAELEAKASRDQATIAKVKLEGVQTAYDEKAAEAERERLERAKQQKRAEAAEAHVSKIKTWLGFALGGLLVLLVQYLPFGMFPAPLSIYLRVGASAAALAAGWFIVARFV